MEINTEGDGEGRRPRWQTSKAPINPASAPFLQDGPSGARRSRNCSLRTRYMQNERDAVKLNLICLVDVAVNQMSTPP